MSFWNKMEERIEERVDFHEPGLFTALLFPITFTFLVTFAISRLIGYFIPYVYLEVAGDLHVHHFTYGIFILAVAGYLALVFDGPRAKFWIALLFGVGLGLAFDEFGMWLRLREDDPVRWEYDGFLIVIALIFFLAALREGVQLVKHLWFRKN